MGKVMVAVGRTVPAAVRVPGQMKIPMKTALVTGSRGFIGRHMERALADRGYLVVVADVRNGERGDILRRIPNEPDGRPFDLVVHCAYRVGGRAEIDGRPMNMAYNMMLDSVLFQWAVKTGVRRVLYFSSSAVYPTNLQNNRWRSTLRLTEAHQDVCGEYGGIVGSPDAEYGWAKLAGERLAVAARREGVRVTVVRPFSGYGADQDTCYPFPAHVKRVMNHPEDQPYEVWGDPESTRDWIHVDDVAEGSLHMVDRGVDGPVNLCTGKSTSFTKLVTAMFETAGKRVPMIVGRTDRPTGVLHRVGDPALMLHYGFTPKVDLREGIDRAFR